MFNFVADKVMKQRKTNLVNIQNFECIELIKINKRIKFSNKNVNFIQLYL